MTRLLTPGEVAAIPLLSTSELAAVRQKLEGAGKFSANGFHYEEAFALLKAAELLPVLHSALERLRSDVRGIFNHTPVPAYDETLCEADAALEAYRVALREAAR